jgi:hypothetical protein
METRGFGDRLGFKRTLAASRFTALTWNGIWAITSLFPGPALETCADCPSDARGGLHLRRKKTEEGGGEGRGRENKGGVLFTGQTIKVERVCNSKSVRSPFSQFIFFSFHARLRNQTREYSIFSDHFLSSSFSSSTCSSVSPLETQRLSEKRKKKIECSPIN